MPSTVIYSSTIAVIVYIEVRSTATVIEVRSTVTVVEVRSVIGLSQVEGTLSRQRQHPPLGYPGTPLQTQLLQETATTVPPLLTIITITIIITVIFYIIAIIIIITKIIGMIIAMITITVALIVSAAQGDEGLVGDASTVAEVQCSQRSPARTVRARKNLNSNVTHLRTRSQTEARKVRTLRTQCSHDSIGCEHTVRKVQCSQRVRTACEHWTQTLVRKQAATTHTYSTQA